MVQVMDENKYHGSACSRCGGTERYKAARNCVPCMKAAADRYKRRKFLESLEERGLLGPCAHGVEIGPCKDCYTDREEERKRKNRDRFKKLWKSDPVKRSAWTANCASRNRAKVESGLSNQDYYEWLIAQDKICHYCGIDCKEFYNIDHYIPVSRGGRHEIFNLRMSCANCNLWKRDKMPEDFYAELYEKWHHLKANNHSSKDEY